VTKVGLIVESGPKGLEAVMCRRICALLAADAGMRIDVTIKTMGNKLLLLEECGSVARALFADKCARVIILWDERPAWPKVGEKLCWHNEREKALAELAQAGIAKRPVYLVCIEREFESWLLFDNQMLECVLSKPEHPVKVAKQRRPDRMANPKALMMTLFRQLAGKPYVDVQAASHFAKCLQDVRRLEKCATFRRFAAAVTGAA
jgi:hypothetical protein